MSVPAKIDGVVATRTFRSPTLWAHATKEARRERCHFGIYLGLRLPGSGNEIELNYYPKGNRFAIRYTKGDEMDHLGFVVNDAKRTYRQLVAKGAKPVIGPGDMRDTELYVADPDGIWIELCRTS